MVAAKMKCKRERRLMAGYRLSGGGVDRTVAGGNDVLSGPSLLQRQLKSPKRSHGSLQPQ
jgi:hypothetical protein